MRPAIFLRQLACALALLTVALAGAGHDAAVAAPPSFPAVARSVRAHMEFLASDAMHGRRAGSAEERKAAEYSARKLREYGIEPGVGQAYIQEVVGKKRAPAASPSQAPGKKAKTKSKAKTWNVVGVLPGADPERRHEVILLSAHLDHVGIGRPVNGDRIYNGADDDASGVTAVLELARALAAGPRPRRTVMFVLFGSEERGGLGSAHFLEHPPAPLTNIVANLQFEMIGRPDKAVAGNTLWLTGYERSTLGPALAAHGAPLAADPHPEQNFFARSDNYVLAKRGVVAHTVSSFGLHADYHRPSDDLARIDFGHLSAAIVSMVEPVRWLADSDFCPQWVAGKKP